MKKLYIVKYDMAPWNQKPMWYEFSRHRSFRRANKKICKFMKSFDTADNWIVVCVDLKTGIETTELRIDRHRDYLKELGESPNRKARSST